MTKYSGRQDFLKMVQNYLDGTATPEEKRFLDAYYEKLDRKSDILNAYSDQEKKNLEAEMERFLTDKIESTEGKMLPLWKKSWSMTAAAVALIIVSVGLVFFVSNVKQPEMAAKTVVPPSDFAPGEDKAILTLADGTSILLDSASNGHIADQAGAVINKSADGQLVYGVSNKEITDPDQSSRTNTVSTPAGGQYRIVLADGSKVWLNAKSSLQFPSIFQGSERRVTITGECYFEIAKNPQMPFIVNVAGKQEIYVTGTNFNINCYQDESRIRTTLLEGSVRVKNLSGTGKVTLRPGEQSAMAADGDLQVKEVDVDEVVAWKNGLFQFQNTSLEMVMRQVARWYNVEVSYEGDMPQKIFSGKIHRNANASQILEILRFAGVNFRMEAAKKEGTTGQIVVVP